MIHPTIQKAYDILQDGGQISKNLALDLAKITGEDTLDLISLANKVKKNYKNDFHLCSIINAKSGVCRENCRFCAQSAHYNADIDVYGLMEPEKVLKAAEMVHQNGVRNFGIVTSGTGYKKVNDEFKRILSIIDAIHSTFPDINVCLSIGLLSQETAKVLADYNVLHYNINLQVNPTRFAELIATTHPIEEKITTIRLLQEYGIKVCCGGIIGVGETMVDRVNMAFTLRELDVTVIPLNVLVPIPGTPLENQPQTPVAEIAKTFAIFRLVNPTKIIKFAAGRETVMKDFQGLLMLAGANGFLTGGYLTTRGREIDEDHKFITKLETFLS